MHALYLRGYGETDTGRQYVFVYDAGFGFVFGCDGFDGFLILTVLYKTALAVKIKNEAK